MLNPESRGEGAAQEERKKPHVHAGRFCSLKLTVTSSHKVTQLKHAAQSLQKIIYTDSILTSISKWSHI